MTSKQRRDKKNDESRKEAENHAQEWSEEECRELVFFWDAELPPEEVAAYFGRTIEACRQKRYMLLWEERDGRNAGRRRYHDEIRDKQEEYVPVPAGPDEDQWWSPTYYTRKGNT